MPSDFSGQNLRGRNFKGQDLTGANFSHTDIRGANFTKANLTGADFTCATAGLQRRWVIALLMVSFILAAIAGFLGKYVGDLMISLFTPNGSDFNFVVGALIWGVLAVFFAFILKRGLEAALGVVIIAISGADLTGTNFTEADLSGATLECANLEHANLKKTQALRTNFNRASLTGACLEACSIDTAILKDIDCQYVFLLEHPNEFGNRDRRPHDPNKIFQPGDFKKYFKEVLDTVQILIRDGINPAAFKTALQTVLEKYPEATVKGIEKQDQDVLLTLKVAENTDKGAVEQDWDAVYQTRLAAAKNAALLESEQRHSEDLKAITLATVTNLGALLSNLTINTTAMTESNNPKISAPPGSFINIGNFTAEASTINLGEISGNVTNTINQLQASATPEATQLAALLKQLQEAIATDPTLAPADKTEALEQVSTLAKAGQNPQDGTLKKLSSTAVKVIKGTIAALPDITKLVEACSKLLPAIVSLLGL